MFVCSVLPSLGFYRLQKLHLVWQKLSVVAVLQMASKTNLAAGQTRNSTSRISIDICIISDLTQD